MDLSWKKTLKISGNYVSCIKMNGIPLLPPLMSQEYRQEMQYYKQLAVAVEQRLNDLQSFLAWQSPSNSTDDDAEKNQTHDYDDFKHDDKVSSHNVNLSLYKNKPIPGHNVNEDDIVPEKEKKCSQYNCEKYPNVNIKKVNDIITKENPNSISNETIVIDKNLTSHPKSLNDNLILCKENESSMQANNNQKHCISRSLSPVKGEVAESPPKLVRQNSYVLESPGPLLQAHLQVQSMCSGVDVLAISMSESGISKDDIAAKRRSWDFEMAKEAWSSVDSLNLTSNSTPSQMPKSKADTTIKAKTKSNSKSLHNSPAKSREQPAGGDKKRSPYSSKFDLLSKAPRKSNFKECESSETDSNNKKDIILHMDRIQMQRILHNMQKDFMIKMSQLIAKQKKEQYYMQKNFEQQRMILLKKLPSVPHNLILTLDSEPLDVISKCNPSINTLSSSMCNPEKDNQTNDKYADHENEHTILSSNLEQSEDQKSFRSYNTLDDINNFTLNSDDNQSWIGSPRVSDLHRTVIDATNTLRAQNENMSKIEMNAKNKPTLQSNCIKELGYESLDLSEFMDKSFIVAYKNESRGPSPRKGPKSLGNEIDNKHDL